MNDAHEPTIQFRQSMSIVSVLIKAVLLLKLLFPSYLLKFRFSKRRRLLKSGSSKKAIIWRSHDVLSCFTVSPALQYEHLSYFYL